MLIVLTAKSPHIGRWCHRFTPSCIFVSLLHFCVGVYLYFCLGPWETTFCFQILMWKWQKNLKPKSTFTHLLEANTFPVIDNWKSMKINEYKKVIQMPPCNQKPEQMPASYNVTFPLHGTARLYLTSVEVPSNLSRCQKVELKHCRKLIGQREPSLAQHGTSCTNPPFLKSQATVISNCNFFFSPAQGFKKNGIPQNLGVQLTKCRRCCRWAGNPALTVSERVNGGAEVKLRELLNCWG